MRRTFDGATVFDREILHEQVSQQIVFEQLLQHFTEMSNAWQLSIFLSKFLGFNRASETIDSLGG
jgi:hypothetical protein